MVNRMRDKSISRNGFDKAYEKVFGHSGKIIQTCIITCYKEVKIKKDRHTGTLKVILILFFSNRYYH